MFSSLSRRRVVVLLVLTCLLLITLDRKDNPVISRVRRVFAVAMEPFETAARVVSAPIFRAWNSFINYDDLARENERLRDQLEHQRGAEASAIANQLALDNLLALNRLAAAGNYPTLLSKVVGAAPGNFQNTVEISLGSADGVAVGMPVTDGAGLVGRITKVKPSSSIVLLITDPGYSVSAEVLMASTGDEPVLPEAPAAPPDPNAPVDPNAPADPNAPIDPNAPVDPAAPVDSAVTGDTTAPAPTVTEGPTCPGMPVPTSTSSSTTTTAAPTAEPPAALDPTTTSSSTTAATTTTTVASVVRETGTLSGQTGDKPLLLRFVKDTSGLMSLCVGATVATAGGSSSLAPQGIPIGTITRIQTSNESGSSAPLVEVTPNAKLSQLNFVAVILFLPNQSVPNQRGTG